MLKILTTLSRSVFHEANEKAEERHALSILGQQVRDASASVRAAQKAVALVKAQNEQERQRADKVGAMIADLETRAGEALKKGQEALAREAAEAIAVLEDERAASRRAQAAFAEEIARLTATVRRAQARLRELQRGQRVVTARDQVRKVGTKVAVVGGSSLTDAEDTLERIQARQKQIDLTETAYAELTVVDNPSDIIDRLAGAGCGPSPTTSADDVLARLKGQASGQPPANDAAPDPDDAA